MQNKKLLLLCGLIISSINLSHSSTLQIVAPQVREENLIIKIISHIGGVPDCYAMEVNFHFPEYPLLTSKLDSSVSIQDFYWETMDVPDRLLDQKIAETSKSQLKKYGKIFGIFASKKGWSKKYGKFCELANYEDALLTIATANFTREEFVSMNSLLKIRAQVGTYEKDFQRLQREPRNFKENGYTISLDRATGISCCPKNELIERYQEVVQDIFNNLMAEEHEE